MNCSKGGSGTAEGVSLSASTGVSGRIMSASVYPTYKLAARRDGNAIQARRFKPKEPLVHHQARNRMAAFVKGRSQWFFWRLFE